MTRVFSPDGTIVATEYGNIILSSDSNNGGLDLMNFTKFEQRLLLLVIVKGFSCVICNYQDDVFNMYIPIKVCNDVESFMESCFTLDQTIQFNKRK